MIELGLKFDMRAPAFGAPAAELYQAALDLSEFVDRIGFQQVRLMEHHGSDDGYLPSPLIMAAAIAARTQHVRVRIAALVLPLHDPVRVAEDAAVVDLISRGRLELVLGAGYVAEEFAMFGRDLRDRPRLLEEGVAALRAAWSGEPFVHDGRPARVALQPYQPGGPPLLLGGWSAASARRAARIGDGFEPTTRGVVDAYLQECARLGKEPGRLPLRTPGATFVHVAEDPEAAWKVLEPHVLHEMNSYGTWLEAVGGNRGFRPVKDIEALRETGFYRVVTPTECLALVRRLGTEGRLELHPLVGGLDPEIGWSSLRLFESEVLPVLREDGLAHPPPD